MVSAELREGISETLDILAHMNIAYTNMIPKSFREFLEENKSQDYISKLDFSKRLSQMNLKEKTKNLLATIYMNYWCTFEQKEKYKKLLIENERKHQEKLREKYNPDDLFKKYKKA